MRRINGVLIAILACVLILSMALPVAAGDQQDYVDNNSSDIDSSADKGTHSDFSQEQAAPDSTFDTLTEADQGTAAVNEWCENDADGADLNAGATHIGDSIYLASQDTNNYLEITKSGATEGVARWYTFDNTAGGSGSSYVVNLSVYVISGDGNDDLTWHIDTDGDDVAEFTGTIDNPNGAWYNTGTISGLNTDTEINAARLSLTHLSSGTPVAINVDAVRLGVSLAAVVNYELDLEVQWTTAVNDEVNEEVCIYVGTMDTENLTVWEWDGASAWVSLGEMDNTGSMWYNFTATELDTTTYTIRFLGDSESGDTTQSTWQIDSVLLHSWTVAGNNAPVNDQAPTCSNLDDSTFLYGKLRDYQIMVYVSDPDGFADIDYLELSLYSNDQGTLYWTVRYDEDTNIFSEEYDPNGYITLNVGGSQVTESGNDIDAEFYITINWNHPDITDTDAYCYVRDDEPESDADYFEIDFDFETRLDYSVTPTVTGDDGGTIDRGDLDEAFTIAGTFFYYGSGTSIKPPDSAVDVWVSASEYGTNVGPWSNETPVSGAFSVTCYADDVASQDTYTIKPVAGGTGSGGTSLYYNSDLTDTYIADQITVQVTTADDSRLNINANSELRVTLWLVYDATYLGSGDTVTLNDVSMNWDAGRSAR